MSSPPCAHERTRVIGDHPLHEWCCDCGALRSGTQSGDVMVEDAPWNAPGIAAKANGPGVFGVKCAGCGHAWSHHTRLLHGNVCLGERECLCQGFL